MKEPINLLHPDVRNDPYPVYAELRRGPVRQVEPGGIWAVSRYDDVQFVLKNPEIFSSGGFQALFKPAWLPHNPIADSIVVMDPPAHTRRRNLVAKAFSARSVAQLEPRIRAIAAKLTERVGRGGDVEFMGEFALPFASHVICEILGLDPALHKEFKHWTDDLFSITPATPSPELEASVKKTIADMEGYLKEVVEARRRAPTDDMVSDLLRAEVDGESLSDAEIIAFFFLLLPAGFETTSGLFSNTLLALCECPGDLARLRADPRLLPAYLEEVLRHNPPTYGILRLTTRDVDFNGVTVPGGSMVVVLVGAATRDAAYFPDPDRFDAGRDNQSPLPFGHGIHFCLGVSLARLEGRVGMEELLPRIRGVERASRELTWTTSLNARSPLALPLRFLPA